MFSVIYLIVPFIIIVITTIIIKWNWFKNLFTPVKNVPTVPVENVPVENIDVKQIENKDETEKNQMQAATKSWEAAATSQQYLADIRKKMT